MTTPAAGGTVVIGIGNLVRSDDGLGVHAVRRLRERRLAGVEIVEGGTEGLMLLPLLADADRVIIVDAIAFGGAPGSLVRLDGGEGIFANGMTPHDLGLADLLDAMRLTGASPRELVLHGAQPGSTEMGTDMTPPVAGALDGLVEAIQRDLMTWGARGPDLSLA